MFSKNEMAARICKCINLLKTVRKCPTRCTIVAPVVVHLRHASHTGMLCAAVGGIRGAYGAARLYVSKHRNIVSPGGSCEGSIVVAGAVAGVPRMYTSLQHDQSVQAPASYAQEDMLTIMAFKRTSYLHQLGTLVQVYAVMAPSARVSMFGELLQNQADYVRDLYDTLCPGWVNVYQWIGDKRLADHSMNGLCTGIEEESPERQLKADYSAMISIPDLWLLSALFAKLRLWFLWEFGQMMQAWIAHPPAAVDNSPAAVDTCEAILHLQYDFVVKVVADFVLSNQSDRKLQTQQFMRTLSWRQINHLCTGQDVFLPALDAPVLSSANPTGALTAGMVTDPETVLLLPYYQRLYKQAATPSG